MFELPLDYDLIFQYLDDYDIYSHYMGEEIVLGQRYKSPLREKDDNPSFSLFLSSFDRDRIYFKDHATGVTGNVFKFISLLFDISYREALIKVDNDFLLGIWNEKHCHCSPKLASNSKVRSHANIKLNVTSKPFSNQDLEYWQQYFITEDILNLYSVSSVQILHFNNGKVLYPKSLCFSYRIGKYYKIYQPFSVDYKFINNYPIHYIEGFEQLLYNQDTLIITKSMKDVMQLRVLGYESVSPKSENTVMDKKYFEHFNRKYTNVFVLFDNDGKHLGNKYPFKGIELPLNTTKDISDFVKKYGMEEGKRIMKDLIGH